MPFGIDVQPLYAGMTIAILGGIYISRLVPKSEGKNEDSPGLLKSFFLFFWSCFVKPHTGDSKGTQQDALESFYKKQAGAYDATRKVLLRGREDMLNLVASQLKAKPSTPGQADKGRIWVDVCGPAPA